MFKRKIAYLKHVLRDDNSNIPNSTPSNSTNSSSYSSSLPNQSPAQSPPSSNSKYKSSVIGTLLGDQSTMIKTSHDNQWSRIELIMVNILEFIGRAMNVGEIVMFSQVCSEWRRLCKLEYVDLEFCNKFPSRLTFRMVNRELKSDFRNLEMLQFYSKATIYLQQHGSIKFIEKFTKCKDLEVHFTSEIDWECLEVVMENITRLKLVCKFSKTDNCCMEYIKRIFPNLKHLTIELLHLSSASVDILRNDLYPKLESFNATIDHFNVECSMNNLFKPNIPCENMTLFSCINDGKFTTLYPDESKFPKLISLKTHTEGKPLSCKQLTRLETHSMSILNDCDLPTLEELIVHPRTQTTTVIQIPVMKLINLKYLNISVMNIALSNIEQFQQLERLTISTTSMHKMDLSILASLNHLKEISITTYFGPGAFANLPKTIKFTKLKVNPMYTYNNIPYVEYQDVEYISQLESLQYLEINLQDNQLDQLLKGNLPNLTVLRLHNPLTKEDILSILQSNLRKVNTLGISKADKPMTKLFKKFSLPRLEIIKFIQLRKITTFKVVKPLLKSPFIHKIKFICDKHELISLEKYCHKNRDTINLLVDEAYRPLHTCHIKKLYY